MIENRSNSHFYAELALAADLEGGRQRVGGVGEEEKGRKGIKRLFCSGKTRTDEHTLLANFSPSFSEVKPIPSVGSLTAISILTSPTRPKGSSVWTQILLLMIQSMAFIVVVEM